MHDDRMSTPPLNASPKNACGADSRTTRSGRCSKPTLASIPSASARARVYEMRKVPMSAEQRDDDHDAAAVNRRSSRRSTSDARRARAPSATRSSVES